MYPGLGDMNSCNEASLEWAILDHIMDNSSTQTSAYTFFTSKTSLEYYEDLDGAGEVNRTLTKCRLDLCAKRYEGITIQDDEMRPTKRTDVTLTKAVENSFNRSTASRKNEILTSDDISMAQFVTCTTGFTSHLASLSTRHIAYCS
jgi:hypothetical protein